MKNYVAPRWLLGEGPAGGHLQTIWPALASRRFDGPKPVFRRERWTAPDGDFIDVDWQADAVPNPAPLPVSQPMPAPMTVPVAAPLLVLFHGLEGSSSSHYAEAFAHRARVLGWRFAVPHFRGCSGELNRLPRAYHSGDFEEIGWILARFRSLHAEPIVAVGISLGGNALLRWAGEAGESASAMVRALAAISSPLDLAAGGHHIGRGFNRHTYTRMFLATMKPKALRLLAQHPGLFSRERLMAARDLYAFDDVFTAPLHGFRGTDDYWSRASAKPHLQRIRVPTLALNARNDPFIPAHSLPKPREVGPAVTLWQPGGGGHVGFPSGRPPGHVMTLPTRVCGWLADHLD